MKEIQIIDTMFDGAVKIFSVPVHADNRGVFRLLYDKEQFYYDFDFSLSYGFDRIYQSYSHQNVFRGLHYQVRPKRDRMVVFQEGRGIDFILDLRKSSPTFGKVMEYEFDVDRMIFIPGEFAHGFFVGSFSGAWITYMFKGYPNNNYKTIRWNDPRLGITLPAFRHELIILDKDRNGDYLEDAEVFE